jgi:hypothetical protein
MTELDDLVRLSVVVHGWQFQARRCADSPDELDELVYSRTHGPWLEVLRVRSRTDARAARVLISSLREGRPQVPWSADGTLAEVLDELTAGTKRGGAAL